MDSPQSDSHDESAEPDRPDERDNLQHQAAGGECRRRRYGVGSGQRDPAHHCRCTHGTHGDTREHYGLDRLRSSCKQWGHCNHQLRVLDQQRHYLDSPEPRVDVDSGVYQWPVERDGLPHQIACGECRRRRYRVGSVQRDPSHDGRSTDGTVRNGGQCLCLDRVHDTCQQWGHWDHEL